MSSKTWYQKGEVIDQWQDAAGSGLKEAERRAVDEYFTNRDGVILDIGCGVGRTTWPLFKRGYSVVGVDASPPMIQRARRRFPDLEFQVADATDLPFDDEAFDYALFSYNGIDCISPERRRYQAFREIRRVLRDDGAFTFSSHNAWFFFPPELSDVWFYTEIGKHWLENLRRGNVTSGYRFDTAVPYDRYHVSPRRQRRQLRECGFELRAMYGNGSWPPAVLHPWPYYVAKPVPDGP